MGRGGANNDQRHRVGGVAGVIGFFQVTVVADDEQRVGGRKRGQNPAQQRINEFQRAFGGFRDSGVTNEIGQITFIVNHIIFTRQVRQTAARFGRGDVGHVGECAPTPQICAGYIPRHSATSHKISAG